eukprot:CAMPEP_0198264318 /NCGR_PEP_ID=MMETSP1447-20131203/15182_1 /TAXON_ID=420782 /ORGANISM="Chaetoceros dichaeta, Strain CCMP1751" /LENGTH=178 /DNA_ID=CAMNT_0043953211 /DNA_START=67 /DNA_END=603 /DNA_ORIENTATION=-
MFRTLKIAGLVLAIIASCTNALSVTSQVKTNNKGVAWGITSSVPINSLGDGCTHHDSLVMMPATLDRPTANPGQSASPAVLDRPTVDEDSITEKKTTGSGAWEVRIYNDGMNTREFVARCLVQITSLSETTAYQTMMQAHQNGIAVVGTYVYELAEMYHGSLKENGIVCDLVPVEEET